MVTWYQDVTMVTRCDSGHNAPKCVVVSVVEGNSAFSNINFEVGFSLFTRKGAKAI